VFIQSRLDRIRLTRKGYPESIGVRDTDLPLWESFSAMLRERPGVLSVPELSRIIDDTRMIKAYVEFFASIIERQRPRAAFVVSYYGSGTAMALNAACHRAGITSVDIQHGCQGRQHFAYGRWRSFPAGGYELLPSVFWCWSNEETSAINEWCQNTGSAHRAVNGGNPVEAMWLEAQEPTVRQIDRTLKELAGRHKGKKQVLYTLQGRLDEAMVRQLFFYVKATAESHFWWLRAHPCHLEHVRLLEAERQRMQLNNVNVAQAASLPLYALLRFVDCHVTGYSSTVLEAERFGVPSVVTDTNADTFLRQALDSGWARPAYSSKKIIAAIDEQISNRKSGRLSRREQAPVDMDNLLKSIMDESYVGNNSRDKQSYSAGR